MGVGIGVARQNHGQAAATLAHQLEFVWFNHKTHRFISQASLKTSRYERRLIRNFSKKRAMIKFLHKRQIDCQSEVNLIVPFEH
jgi:hypothetical protein